MNDTERGGEAELLARLRRGDDDAFAALFRVHYPALVVNATRLLGERALAEEIVQDVMLELWRRREALALSGPLAAYLSQATRNRALNRIRQEKTARLAEPFVRAPAAVATADERTISAELQHAVDDAMASLSAAQREVFDLSRTRGLTYPEIAGVLGISVKTVEARMGRALKQLRERLAPWLPERSS